MTSVIWFSSSRGSPTRLRVESKHTQTTELPDPENRLAVARGRGGVTGEDGQKQKTPKSSKQARCSKHHDVKSTW